MSVAVNFTFGFCDVELVPSRYSIVEGVITQLQLVGSNADKSEKVTVSSNVGFKLSAEKSAIGAASDALM